MNEPSLKSDNREDAWLRERIAEAVGPSDASQLTDSELDALLNAYQDASYSEDRVEHLLARFWTELAQKKSLDLADSSSSNLDLDDSDDTPAPPKSPVLGFLGDLMGSDGWPNASTFSGYLIAALTAIGLALSIAVVLLAAGLLSRPGPKDVAQSPQEAERERGRKGEGEIPPSPRPPVSPSPRLPFSPAPPVARLIHAADCRWNGRSPAPELNGPLVAGQSLSLACGAAEINFDIGAKLILQGPASLQLLSGSSVKLEMGKVTMEIKTAAARGFRILTPEATFVDQGTEFGVEVAPGGSTKVHVFKGLVDIDRNVRSGKIILPIQRLVEDIGARLEPGDDGIALMEDTGECFIRSIDQADRDRHVVAYWRFEDRPLGSVLPHTAANKNPVRATTDSSFNGNDLFLYRDLRPRISGDVPAGTVPQTGVANRRCLESLFIPSDSGHADLYTRSQFSHASPLDIQTITPAQWTIEASVKTKSLPGWVQTFVGRDGCRQAVPPESPDWKAPRLALQISSSHRFAVSFVDGDQRLHEAVAAQLPVEAGRWYNVAATSDGRDLRLYVDANDGRGYRLQAQTVLPKTGSTSLGIGTKESEWSIGRGRDRHWGGPGEPFDGWIDEVRISDIAREPAEFLFTPRGQGRKEKGIAQR